MENDEDPPYRCTRCGSTVDRVVKGDIPATDAAYTQLDERFARAWCPWERRAVDAVRARSVVEAVHHPRPPKNEGTQMRGSW